MNGAEIAALCHAASMEALREQIRNGTDVSPCLERRHFEAAFRAEKLRRQALERENGDEADVS